MVYGSSYFRVAPYFRYEFVGLEVSVIVYKGCFGV